MKFLKALLRVGVVTLLTAAVTARAGNPPWVQAALSTDVSDWKEAGAFVWLLDSESAQFETPNRTRTLVRQVVRLHGTSRPSALGSIGSITYTTGIERIVGAHAWCIPADGKKAITYSRGEFSDAPVRTINDVWTNRRQISLPWNRVLSDVVFEGVVAWEFEVEADSSIFDASHRFLRDEPVAFGNFEVVPAPGTHVVWHATDSSIGQPVGGGKPGSLLWQMRRITPAGLDEPEGFIHDRLEVAARCESDANELTASRLESWKTLSSLIADVIEPRVEITGDVAAKAANLTAGRPARWDRVRALSEFVQRDITYLSLSLDRTSLAGYRPHLPGETLRDRYGDCKDKASLLVGLLRACGDNGFVVLAFAGNPCAVPADWPSACFNHAIVAIPADDAVPADWPVVVAPDLGRLVLFDPTDSVAPLGVLPQSDQAGRGLIVHRDAGSLVQLPSESADSFHLDRRVAVTLDSFGGLRASVEETRDGAGAADSFSDRTSLRDQRFGDALQTRIVGSVPLAKDLRWFDSWQPEAARHLLKFDFAAERHARSMGRDRLLISPQIIEGTPRFDRWKTTVKGTVWLPVTSEHEVVRISLPDGFVIDEVPENFAGEIAGTVRCKLEYRIEGSEFVYERILVQNAGLFEKAGYESLRAFMQKLGDAERRPAILRRR